MAINEQHKAIQQTITNTLEIIIKTNVKDLIQEKDLGQLSFIDCNEIFKEIIDISEKVNNTNLRGLPFIVLRDFNTILHNIKDIFEKIAGFNVKTNNLNNIRDNLIQELFNHYDTYFLKAQPILLSGILIDKNLDTEKRKFISLLNEAEEKKNAIEDKHKEAAIILENVQKGATEAGVTTHATIFGKNYLEYNKKVKLWLFLVLVLLVVILYTIYCFSSIAEDISQYEIIQYTINRILILTTLFYALSFVVRNYKATQHNATVNKHRQNALSTFETFIKAAGSDIQTKNAVLLEATHTIFSHQNTGYLKGESEGDSQNKIIEIIKNVTSKD